MTAAEDATSPNFGFLAKLYPELERIAARSDAISLMIPSFP